MADKPDFDTTFRNALPAIYTGGLQDSFAHVETFLKERGMSRDDLMVTALATAMMANVDDEHALPNVANDNAKGWHDKLSEELGDEKIAADVIVVYLVEKLAKPFMINRRVAQIQETLGELAGAAVPTKLHSNPAILSKRSLEGSKTKLIETVAAYGGVGEEVAKVAVHRFADALDKQAGIKR